MCIIRCSDIVQERADALIYSTNVFLNCSGGVGGALLAKYGGHVQTEVHSILSSRGSRFAARGEVFDLVPSSLPYLHLLHCVPCDGMYETTPSIVENVRSRALEICAADPRVQRVAVSALATGYGRLPFDEFVPIASRVFTDIRFAGISEIVLCLENEANYARALDLIGKQKLPLRPQ